MRGTAWQPSSSSFAPTLWAISAARLRVEHRAEHVRDMGERDQLVRRVEHRGHRVEIDAMVGGQRHDVDFGAGFLGDHLPGDDVA